MTVIGNPTYKTLKAALISLYCSRGDAPAAAHMSHVILILCMLCCADGKLTDMLSFYTLPSTVIGNPTYKTLKAAFMYYTVAKETPLQQLMTDALILACNK